MRPLAYIQKRNGEFSNINFLTAHIALTKFFGYRAEFFEHADEIIGKVTKDTIVYAGIPVMDRVFEWLGVAPRVEYYPDQLKCFLARRVELVPVSVVRDLIDGDNPNPTPIFVKPSIDLKKSFTGRVCKKFIDLLYFQHLKEDDKVWMCDVLNIVSEYRCFVHKKFGVLGVKHYAGKWEVPIDPTVPEYCRELFKDSPMAYSLDLGVTASGKTVLVECNDCMSLGCYGLDPSAFGVMIVDRWNEIMGLESRT